MSLFTYTFGIVIVFISFMLYLRSINTYSSIIFNQDKTYDYIIVGAGTTGCVLAARLTEDPNNKVLLIEAGDHMSYFTKIPLTPTAAQQGPYDWSFKTTPQKYSSFGYWNQTQILPRGKGLGGSGQLNFMLHGVGLPEDYERWESLGFKGWSFEHLKPYFLKAFGTDSAEFDSKKCFVDGTCRCSSKPMKLKLIDPRNELMKIFKEASSGSATEGVVFKRPTATILAGARVSTWDAYLKPALTRRNLHVLLKTAAISIRFEQKTAVSLFILKDHRELNNVFVNKEIILAAGTIKTPQILMLSGVGPRRLLKKLKIKTVAENERVGKNVHDHLNMPVYVSIKKPISITLSKIYQFKTFWDYIWKKEGFLAFPPLAGIEYVDNSALMLFSMGSANEKLMRDLSNYKPEVFRKTFPYYSSSSKEGFIFLATCTQPRSRGVVTISDISTNTPPLVNTNYLKDIRDVECIVKGLKRAAILISSKPFQDIGAKIHWPRPERCQTFWNKYKNVEKSSNLSSKSNDKIFEQAVITEKDRKNRRKIEINSNITVSNDYLECIVRELAVTGHHISGTCSGGQVVDGELRLKSVTGVRIIDASVIPSPISLFPNSVLVAMAEKAAELIQNVRKHKK